MRTLPYNLDYFIDLQRMDKVTHTTK